MEKSVYSLVLMDEIVAAVDVLAARMGRSRSAMVNYILAEYTSMTTPQAKTEKILTALSEAAEQSGLRIFSHGNKSLTIRTALSYKYNPALSYTVEIDDTQDDAGELRLSLRSQSEAVLGHFSTFMNLWERLEGTHLNEPPDDGMYAIADKKYQRQLRLSGLREEEMGAAMAEYISMLDACMKTFFQNAGNGEVAALKTEKVYKDTIEKTNAADKL